MRPLLLALLLLLHVAIPEAHGASIDLEHFSFHASEGTAGATRRLAEVAEARFDTLCAPIGACDLVDTPIDVWLAEDAEAFASAFPDGSPMSEWAVGVTFVGKNRVVLRAHGSALFSLLETFDHELSHVLLHKIAARDKIPRWFSEGVAIWQAGEAVVQRLASAQHASLTSNLIPLADLTDRFPRRGPEVSLAYAQSSLFVRYLERQHGVDALPVLIAKLGAATSFDEAFQEVYGAPVVAVEALWAEELDQNTAWIALARDSNLLWGAMSILFVLTSWVKLRRRREALDAMEVLEAEQRDARRAAAMAQAPVLH
jgi:hypothetical protein